MDTNGLALLGIAVMVVSLFLIPIGLPGLWIMILVLLVGTWTGLVHWVVFLALLALVLAAELVEWAAVDRLGRRYGGTRRTFWGALAGGILGAIVGVPVPLVGSLIGVLIGTFAGATLVTWHELRDRDGALRAGWGATLGRTFAIALKVATGLVILVFGGAALLV
jgi:hypothetical protein